MVKHTRFLCVGPGGRNCPCCFPAPGSQDRRKQYRAAKRKADREAMREAMNDYEWPLVELIDLAKQEDEEINRIYGEDMEWAQREWESEIRRYEQEPWQDQDYDQYDRNHRPNGGLD